jgi:hypothetical protein
MLPGFLIAGAQRCGTTSLYRALSAHPLIVKAPRHKGIHYFDMNYERSLAWYQAHFTRRAEDDAQSLTFESSPYYMFHPLAPGRIAHDLPGVKLLVLVRDPVERAHSAHAHELARGFETEPFERALELEGSRLRGEVDRIEADPHYLSFSHQHHAYRSRGRYSDQLQALESQFGPERILVIDSGNFFASPERTYDRVLDFLGLPHCEYPIFERHNAEGRSALPDALRAELSGYFQPYDERLTKWIGDIPSWRREPLGEPGVSER